MHSFRWSLGLSQPSLRRSSQMIPGVPAKAQRACHPAHKHTLRIEDQSGVGTSIGIPSEAKTVCPSLESVHSLLLPRKQQAAGKVISIVKSQPWVSQFKMVGVGSCNCSSWDNTTKNNDSKRMVPQELPSKEYALIYVQLSPCISGKARGLWIPAPRKEHACHTWACTRAKGLTKVKWPTPKTA